MNSFFGQDSDWTLDQADGLRRMFARTGCTVVPLVSNPHVQASGVAVERLAAVLSSLGRKTLVVDAGETSPPPAEASALELAPCIEHLSSTISYLAARGLPRRYVDTQGSAARLLDELTRLVPDAQVLLLHASAADLARLCTGRQLCPVVLAGDHSESVKHAYAGLKLLVQRAGWKSFDLLLMAARQTDRVSSIAATLADCADQFLGVSLHDWTSVDELASVRQAPGAGLQRLVAGHLRPDTDGPTDAWRAAPMPGLSSAGPRS